MRYGFHCTDQQQQKSYISNSHTHKKKVFSGFASFFTFFSSSFLAQHTPRSLGCTWQHQKTTHWGKKKLQRLEHTIRHACTQTRLETGPRYSIPGSGETFCFVFFPLLEMRYWRHARSTITHNFCACMRVNKSVYDSTCHCYCGYSLPLLCFFLCVCALYCRSPNIVASVQNSKKHEKRRVKKKGRPSQTRVEKKK